MIIDTIKLPRNADGGLASICPGYEYVASGILSMGSRGGCLLVAGASGLGGRAGSALGPQAELLLTLQNESDKQQGARWMESMDGGDVERRNLLSGPSYLLGSSQREEKHETEFELESHL